MQRTYAANASFNPKPSYLLILKPNWVVYRKYVLVAPKRALSPVCYIFLPWLLRDFWKHFFSEKSNFGAVSGSTTLRSLCCCMCCCCMCCYGHDLVILWSCCGHLCRSLVSVTCVGHLCRSLVSVTCVGHLCRSLVSVTCVGHLCWSIVLVTCFVELS